MRNTVPCVALAVALACTMGGAPGCQGNDYFPNLGGFGGGGPYGIEDGGASTEAGFSGNDEAASEAGAEAGTEAPHPDFGPTVTLASAPPAISGGTLLLTQSGTTLVASDSDRDQIYVVDLPSQTLTTTIALSMGDEPGRLVEDGDQQVHVALRRGGAVVTLDLTTSAIVDRRPVCAAPRGIAYDPSSDNLYVACNGGELVTLPAAGGAPTRTLELVTDLRDVVVNSGNLYVSRLRQAEVIEIDSSGSVTAVANPPVSSTGMVPDVAWRMIAAPPSSNPEGILPSDQNWLAMVHQRAQPAPVSTGQGGYGQSGSGCPQTSIVETTITTFNGTSTGESAPSVPAAVLPVDLAASPDGSTFAVVAAGNANNPGLPAVFFVARSADGTISSGSGQCGSPPVEAPVSGQPTAVVFVSDSVAWVQSREPASLIEVVQVGSSLSVTKSIMLSTVSRRDTGHDVVHSNSGDFIACASCHAEGGDDARVWKFSEEGASPARRTQSMRGTLENTAPYHWEGDMMDIPALAHEVFVSRMGGQALTDDQSAALQAWLFAVPRPHSSPQDAASATRGAALFQSTTVGCSGCHSGPHFTNNMTLDVGTGGKFQVPSLIGVGWRAPYFHDGRAPQLIDRFNPALSGLDGSSHGDTSQLTTSQVDDLVTYLLTL
jgi:hypothetical protein